MLRTSGAVGSSDKRTQLKNYVVSQLKEDEVPVTLRETTLPRTCTAEHSYGLCGTVTPRSDADRNVGAGFLQNLVCGLSEQNIIILNRYASKLTQPNFRVEIHDFYADYAILSGFVTRNSSETEP